MNILLKWAGILIISSGIVSCTIKTEIIKDDGSIYIVKSKSDSMVKVEEKDMIVIVDNRGRPSFLEQLITLMFMDMEVNTNEEEDE